MERRHRLQDEQWSRICMALPGKVGDPGRHGLDNRAFVEGVMWLSRTGSSWRDWPPECGKWYTAWQRFNRWSEKGVWQMIFNTLAADADTEWLMIDSTIVRAHQHAAGAKGGRKIRPSDEAAAGSAPKSMRRAMPTATPSASSSRAVKRTT